MSSLSSSLKLVSPVSQLTASNYSDMKVTSVAMVMIKRADDIPIQVRGKVGQKEQATETFTSVSRRDIASYFALASLAAATIISPEPAEARIVKPEIKRKIFEKLKMLREKFGLSKPDTEDEKNTSPPDEGKEKPLPPPPNSPFPVPTTESALVYHEIDISNV